MKKTKKAEAMQVGRQALGLPTPNPRAVGHAGGSVKLSLHAALVIAALIALEILWTEGAKAYWRRFEAKMAMQNPPAFRWEGPGLRR